MQWMTLFKKELLENWRNKKWIWVPLVIILLSIMDPITSYYLPQIIDSVGGLPEGSTLEMPEFAPPEVIMMSLSQLSSLGVLVLVLMSMGTIAGERKSGVTELILVKPVAYRNYITAKWVSLLMLVWISLFLGLLTSWYYINLLFGDLSFVELLQITFFYGLWLTLVVSLSIFYNALIKTPGLVAFLTILTIMVMSLINQVFNHVLEWFPNNLSSYILDMLMTDQLSTDLIATACVTMILSIALVVASIYTFRVKD
ncbi:ABC transporter permease subunit [Ornithinibacillus sp. L9]|uniref:ABC transporter permease subunit n=1 Tax=Ornithinibacillus caprae TaxID=2678566 RepID=A0A6N8FK25_9BACI|nr:ABC transporter permease subunit [Ornithinibacillus caprae]MUK88337.1 ABC transporter permease subunit [Ornithinibacillus caprae]